MIVGAGPVGSYTAYQLSAEGLDVAVIEKKRNIGEDIICSGIVGTEAFKRFDLPESAIIARIQSVRVFSPHMQALDFEREEPLAFVVDREVYDRQLSQRAMGQGAVLFTDHDAQSVELERDGVRVLAKNGTEWVSLKSRLCVLATGTHYRFQRRLGLDMPSHFMIGAQVSTPVDKADRTEIYVGSDIAPASFGWVVPADGRPAKIGVLTPRKPKAYLKRLLESRLNGRAAQDGFHPKAKLISNDLVGCTSADRVLAVGEAAGQVKTTTGGGLFFGLVGSELAVHVIKKAFARNDLSKNTLSEYDKLWHSELGEELRFGLLLRRFISRLSDEKIESLLSLLDQRKGLRDGLLRGFQFDNHSEVIKAVLRYGGRFLTAFKNL